MNQRYIKLDFFQSCFDEGVDYFGNDLEDGQFDSTSSAAECQTHCQQSQGCNFWTWDPGYNNACWKKSAKGPIQTNARLTSGPKTCAESNPTTVPPNSTPDTTTAPPDPTVSIIKFKHYELSSLFKNGIF